MATIPDKMTGAEAMESVLKKLHTDDDFLAGNHERNQIIRDFQNADKKPPELLRIVRLIGWFHFCAATGQPLEFHEETGLAEHLRDLCKTLSQAALRIPSDFAALALKPENAADKDRVDSLRFAYSLQQLPKKPPPPVS